RGVLPSVLFCPDDLDMVKRSASVRRAALDDFGMQLNEQYARLVGAYERTVEQRNNLLKERFIDPALLSVWDDALVSTGAALMAHRAALLARIRGHFVGVHAAIAPTEAADIDYAPSFDLEAPASTLDRRALEEGLAHALASSREDERRRGVTLVGPHRDEVLFSIDGREARSFGSQGQQRSLVLAWKIAEVEVTGDILGHAPLLLLDDVMSELDAQRRSSIVSFIAGDIQTVITTTNLGYFEEQVLERAKVVRIDAA
ncbi:MAG: DNA replication and repair protein RecF, partial [Collinsella sp.]|nr:DNA replication and repair protein RecF [Collinsella sp.]